jgi:uncharacterized protein YbjT (DUF2867 family)
MKGLLLVVGATGRTGQHVVYKAVQRGLSVRALVRDTQRAHSLFGDTVQIVTADVRQPETLQAAFGNVNNVICATGGNPRSTDTPEKIDFEGVRNQVEAAQAAGVSHFVLVSSIAVTKPDHPLNAFGQILSWKLKGEYSLRNSDLVYTIVRPGGLTDEQGGQSALQIDQGDRISGKINRADVAEVCLQALEQPKARNTTFEVIEGLGPASEDWSMLFSGLNPDSLL